MEATRMKKHDESRRAFLIGAAMGAAATTTLVPDAIAQTHEPRCYRDVDGHPNLA